MAFTLAAGEGETFWWESQLFTIKCSEGGLVDCTLEARSEPPMQIHTRETEFIYVLDGELSDHELNPGYRQLPPHSSFPKFGSAMTRSGVSPERTTATDAPIDG